MMDHLYLILFALGAYHGINPAMGWLFAAALGLQYRSRKIIVKSLIALILGHAVAVGVVVIAVGLLGLHLPLMFLKLFTAALLLSLGIYHLFRQKHLSWFGMQIGVFGIFCWSFLMATSHGAGLMLIPVLLHNAAPVAGHAGHIISHETVVTGLFDVGLIVAVHTLGYLLMATLMAFLIYEKLGVAILKKAWINFDLIWAVTLIVTACFLLLW